MSITRVNTNYDAIFASNALKSTELQLQNAMRRISSGKRINCAGDDPAGVGQLTMAKSSLGGARQAQMNIQQDLAMLQFVDGEDQVFEDKVIELKDMAIKAANDTTLSTAQAAALATEFTDGLADLGSGRMNGIMWNGKAVMGPLAASALQTGGTATDTIAIAANTTQMNSTNQGVGGNAFSGAVVTAGNATAAITTLNTALGDIATARATVGTLIERLNFALDEQLTMETNYTAAVSTIGDADLASEISKMTTSQILSQSGAAMLGQANIQAQTLLNILT